MANTAPVARLRKDEIIWLANHKCRHSHTYLEHYACYLKENPNQGTIGFLDIETSNLDANFGVMYCYCIKDANSKTIHYDVIKEKDIKSDNFDKHVVQSCINDIKKFDRIVTYYGTRFDIPFIRSRAVHLGLEFPEYGGFLHTDLYYLVKSKFKLHSNRLKVACQFLLGATDKTVIEYKHWIKAMQGNKKALEYILEHCKYDVLDLEKLYYKIIPFRKRLDRPA